MFKSATIKLTAWYLALVIALSLSFSAVIYYISATEINIGVTSLQRASRPFFVDEASLTEVRSVEFQDIKDSLIGSLIVTNLIIWTVGGVGSYYLARRTLKPIEEAHEAQSRFTSDASHELRTPLANMKTEMEVALNDPDTSSQDMRELLRSNLDEVDTLARLSYNLLQLARLENDHVAQEKVRLSPTIKNVLQRFGPESSRVSLVSNRSYNITADRLHVEELATILLDNAVKYSPSSSEVEIKIIKHKTMAGFEISDKGQGIHEDDLTRIFNRFYQSDSSRSQHTESKSYGLGLSLARRIVSLHGGELSVSSALGVGTKFSVLLPMYKNSNRK